MMIQQYEQALKDFTYNIKEVYYKILFSKNQIQLLKKIIERRQNNITLLKLKYHAGVENANAVEEMSAELTMVQFNLFEKEEELTWSQKSLISLIGEELSTNMEIKNITDSYSNYSYQTLFHSVCQNSIELQLNSLQEEIEKEQIRLTQGDYFPDIYLSSQYGVKDYEFLPKNKNWNFTLSFTWPLFSGWKTTSFINESKSRFKKLGEEKKEVQNKLELHLSFQIKQYNLLLKKKDALNVKYQAIKNNYAFLKLQYQKGNVSYLWLKDYPGKITTIHGKITKNIIPKPLNLSKNCLLPIMVHLCFYLPTKRM